MGCSNLKSIRLPESLEYISSETEVDSNNNFIAEYNYFEYCDSLMSIFVKKGSIAEELCRLQGYGDLLVLE